MYVYSAVSRPQGLIVRDILRNKLLNKNIILHTVRDTKGKYGRYLGTIDLGGVNINNWLVRNKMAVPYLP